VHVATYSKGESVPKYHDKVSYQTHKVSLDFYRKASQQIMRIIKRFCPLFQRASIDEAYADITSAVDARIKQVNINGKYFYFTLDSIDWSSNNTFYIGKDDNSCGLDDWRLYLGSEICQEIRDAIYKECGYTCSAGIAHNKTLAKLVSSMHKPNKQSVLCQSQVLTFLKDLPASKIKGLGGKLGAEIEAEYGMKSCGDLWTLSIEDFMKDTSSGSWIYHIIRGIDDDPGIEIFLSCSC
jgi:DNA polymerase eta